ncbi:MAG TPA: FAD:protein FMN transferase [Bacilli bacterium]|nr:FAD:protein FMN transferase [Bacilli bacterium]
MKKLLTIIIIILFVAFLTTQTQASTTTYEWISKSDYLGYLNTPSHVVRLQYQKSEANRLKALQDLDVVKDILLTIEANFSISQTPIMESNEIEESLLMKVNRLSGIEAVVVNDDFIELIELSIEMAELTNGLFDPTIGPLTSLWDISMRSNICDGFMLEPGDNYCDAPSSEAINQALSLVDYTKIQIDKIAKTVYLPTPGMKLDLGGIAKGYAADKVISFFVEEGYQSVILSLGGNIHTYGKDLINNANFPVEIRDPFSILWYNRIGGMRVQNQSVVTSGTYERFIIDDEGNRYHHLLNAKTGYPFESDLVSVTILSPSSAIADALATGLYGLSLEEGIALVEADPNLEAVFVTTNKHIYKSNTLKFTYDTKLNDDGFVFHGENFRDDALLYPNGKPTTTNPIVYIGITIASVGVSIIGYAIYLAVKKKPQIDKGE